MTDCENDDWGTIERIAKLTWNLAAGQAYTTEQAATLTGLSYSYTLRLLKRLSDILPIMQDEEMSPLPRYWFAVYHIGITPVDWR